MPVQLRIHQLTLNATPFSGCGFAVVTLLATHCPLVVYAVLALRVTGSYVDVQL